jgi:hypothetical protein
MLANTTKSKWEGFHLLALQKAKLILKWFPGFRILDMQVRT